jgi:predicted RecA/RadA family phage recombinase
MTTRLIAHPGDVWDHVASGAKASGDVVVMGDTVGVCLTAIANGAIGAVEVAGVFRLTKLTADVVVQGAKLYWDAGNSRLTITASTHKYAGRAAAAAGGTSTTADVMLNAAA